MAIELSTLDPYSDENGNSISTGARTEFFNGMTIFKEYGASIEIGDDVDLSYCNIELGRNSTLKIGDRCRITGSITVGFSSSIILGNDVYATGKLALRAVETTNIEIGDDCLFGSNVSIRTSDGHPIYDTQTRARINKSESITIGNHVWIADDALILKGATIGDASVIGAKSVVSKDVGPNSVAAGNPARVVRTGVTWEHSPQHHTEEYYVTPDDAEVAS